jgi:hypothetical protein
MYARSGRAGDAPDWRARLGAMASVTAVVLHRPAPASAGPLEQRLAAARFELGCRLLDQLRDAGASDGHLIAEPADDTPFGARLRAIVAERLPPSHGLVVAGAGSAALARAEDLAPFVATAATPGAGARTNNPYSADIVALADPSALRVVPDLPSDNALPRWLAEVAGVVVHDERRRWRLGVDIDSPLDLVLIGWTRGRGGARGAAGQNSAPSLDGGLLTDRLQSIATVLADRRAEVVVAGRTSATSLRWLERNAAARIRAWVEERGLRASSPLAVADRDAGSATRVRPTRPPASVLGALLDVRGPSTLGTILATFGEAALVDSRVLLAHRLGADERAWPPPEDRFAADLLLVDRISDPWLRALTEAARDSPIPVVLGGHTLVGPGIRLVQQVGRRR